MDHAWLDSLSEDWVSQPASDTSASKLPISTRRASRRKSQSRIPRRTPTAKSSLSSALNTSTCALSERSANDINIASLRLPSALSQQAKAHSDDRASQSALSAGGGSVVRNSVQRHSSSGRRTETPEWKRRLVHGRIPYGEQRDLFSSAAAGLQDIFKPPALGEDGIEQSLTTLPSSPPFHSRPSLDADLEFYVASEDDDEPNVQIITTPSPSPRRPQREIKYTLNIGALSSSNMSDSVPGPGWTPHDVRRNGETAGDGSRAYEPDHSAGASRKTSGQSDVRNEDLSPILIGKHNGQDGRVDFAPIEMPVEQLKQKLERLRINQMIRGSQPDLLARFAEDRNEPTNAETTEEYMHNGGFINSQRGGRSGGVSFYNRALSSDIGVDSSEMLPEESLQASTPKQFPTIQMQASNPRPNIQFSFSPSLPLAPFPSPDKRQVREAEEEPAVQPAGSPLKLFGPYDTFTNQTLLRRISQFEEASGSPSRASLNSPEQESYQMPEADDDEPIVQHARAVSRFGDGDLDGYEFTGDMSYESSEDPDVHDKENVAPVPALPIFTSPQPLQELQPDHESGLFVRRRRQKSSTPGASMANSQEAIETNDQSLAPPTRAPALAMTPKHNGDSEGKRPRTSPSKDPTPKRRRTLHETDIAFSYEHKLAAVDSAHHQMQAMMGQKSKGGPSGPVKQTVSGGSHDTETLLPSDDSAKAQGQPSIRTQDFVDQAAQIMAMIRSQVRPQGLASVEESEAENMGASPRPSLTGSSQESTSEPLSRPPSREGRPLSRIPQRQEDPELLRRLRQYQERSDAGDGVASSLQSMSLGRTASSASGQHVEKKASSQSLSGNSRPIHAYGGIVTDLPNVRITPSQGPDHASAEPHKDFPTNSSERSTSRTFPTTSSRGSESRRTIMPESVSHLIPDRVGSMYLDKQKNVWIKKKAHRPAPRAHAPPSDDSEEDPFASIPDLSVDMTKELQNLRLATIQRETVIDNAELQRSPRSPLGSHTRQGSRGYAVVSPQERPGPHMAAAAREQLGKLEARASMRSAASHEDASRSHGATDSRTGDAQSSAKRRNLTISFSSPIASVIHDVAEDLDSLEDDPDKSQLGVVRSVLKPQFGSRGGVAHGPCRPSSARGPGFVPRPVSRIDEQDEESTVEIQLDEHRQISIIGENSVVSHRTPDGRHASLSFIINHTPNMGALSFQPDESALIGHNVGRLSLSPLSEFTLNNSEQSFGFEVSYVMGRRHMATGDGSKRVMSMTIRELVDKLGEVEPYEPFWEDMTDLDLHGKQLASLHMLDEFCGRVVTLDASGNRLGHLDGVPSTVRHLKVCHNLLTELTSWDHLMNLQYIDISGNEVKSLSALKNLVHLRSVRADDNQLTGLDGFEFHDGLLSLRARNNAIERLDFSTTGLERLAELDLEGNRISSIEGLDRLPALARLRLRGNRLRQLPATAGEMGALRQLDVSDNELTELDVGRLPSIRSVQADRNRIQRLRGFERARRLDSLSLREQRGDARLDLGFLGRAYELRKLFLSGNYLGAFEPAVDFLNLQLLDLANCGLQRLPERMGQQMANLRTLNVNFNAIGDLSPLQFVPRLKKLLAAGNRLADSTAVTRLLTEFPHLTQLDVRDNPVTLGLYAPVQVLVPRATEDERQTDPFALPDADAARDASFAGRLDEATRLRRRLHQVVLVASCRRLRKLDGLSIRRQDVLARDELLERLAADGVVAGWWGEESGPEAPRSTGSEAEARAPGRPEAAQDGTEQEGGAMCPRRTEAEAAAETRRPGCSRPEDVSREAS
ncbi:hypothetical protein CDD83_11217 [Cordyceps sp. RAO-2017]|nr:hypothetical protein CDD83_11217 [Cordyceps sp. RAO-2017]